MHAGIESTSMYAHFNPSFDPLTAKALSFL
jgi:hypothetical protein